MRDEVRLTVDDTEVVVAEGATLLDAARAAGSTVPTICFHEATTANALCRICVVEVEGAGRLQPACIAAAAAGMAVITDSERVARARRTMLEMLASSVDLSDAPEILTMIREHRADPDRFPAAERREPPVVDDNPMYVRDYAKCVMCWRCVQVCAEDAQRAHAINFSGRGYQTAIGTFYDRSIPETTCVFCGQCLGVCPSGALKPRREWQLETGMTPAEIMVDGLRESGRRRR